MEIEFPIWRIWMEKKVSLYELKYNWTYEDILKANALLDMKDEIGLAMDMWQEINRGRK